jgi:hypothetical protein
MEEIHISFLELQSWSLEFVDSKIEDIRVYILYMGFRSEVWPYFFYSSTHQERTSYSRSNIVIF